MKKVSILLVCLLSVPMMLMADQSQAQRNLMHWITKISKHSRFQSLHVIKSPQYWNSRSNGSKEIQVRLRANKRYVLIASGDNKAVDIDMYVYDSRNKLVAMDEATPRRAGALGSDAGVVLMPLSDEIYKAKVISFTTTGNELATCCFTLAEF